MFLRQFTKPLPFLALIAATYPVLMILSVLLAGAGARLYLGHWPSFNNPDPKQIAWGLPQGTILICLMIVPVSPLCASALALYGRWQSKEFPLVSVLTLTGISLVAFFAFARIDPGGFLNWLAD